MARLTEKEYQRVRKAMLAQPLFAKAILTERQYEIGTMYFVEQMWMNDIAETLGINKSTVSRSISLVRKKYQEFGSTRQRQTESSERRDRNAW